MKESELQKAILEYLTLKKIYHLRLNSGQILVNRGKIRYMVNLCPMGTPDIFVLHNGKSVYLEVKKDKKEVEAWFKKIENFKKDARLYPSNQREVMQYKEHEKIRKAGGEVYVVGDLEEVTKIL